MALHWQCLYMTTGVRSVTAVTIAGYHDVSEFECDVIVGAREMVHSISKVVMSWGFSQMTISLVHHEYQESGKTSNLRHCCGQKKILKEQDQRRLKRIVQCDRSAALPQITADFNAGLSTSVSM